MVRKAKFILYVIFFRDAQWNCFQFFNTAIKISVQLVFSSLGSINSVYILFIQFQIYFITELTASAIIHCIQFIFHFVQKEDNYFSSLSLHTIFLAVFTTAVRSSRRRQQYKDGVIQEFKYTNVTAKSHSVSQYESPSRVNKTYIGK